MRYPKNSGAPFSVITLLIILFVIMGCGDDGGPTGPKLPADPGQGNLAGIIVGTINRQPIAGATVSVGPVSTNTDADGIFRLDGVGEGILGVVIAGENIIYTRTAAVNTANGRSVLLDAIEANSSFHLEFYRELARGNHPDERDVLPEDNLFQTHRWINPTAPTFIIATNADATLDGVIDQDSIDAVRDVISQIVSDFTGNFYSSVPIETRKFAELNDFSDIPDNSFVFIFDDTIIQFEALGAAITEPDFISPEVSTINKAVIFLLDFSLFYALDGTTLEKVTAHETGHGFGFRHTSLLTSIMRTGDPFEGLVSEADRLHMEIVYRRPPGNTDIDNDPVPGAKMFGQPLGVQVHIDKLTNAPKLSPELIQQLQSLRSHSILKRYINQ